MLMRSLAEGVELYCGDCRDILPSITERRSIVTDPPFSIRHHFGRAVHRPGKGTRALQFEWDAKMTREEVVIGIEIEPKWFDLSCRQIEAALQVRGPDADAVG